MNVKRYEGKNKEELINDICEKLMLPKDALIIIEHEVEKGLFKNKVFQLEVITYQEVIDYIKHKLLNITSLMNIEINMEINVRDEIININVVSNNSSILIGKNGRTIEALQYLIKQMIHNELNTFININLDVDGYKEKNRDRLERLAKNIARDVINTKVEVKLDNMNAYERKIIHTSLSDSDGVTTESFGEEPNRYIVIKPKD